MAQGDSIWQLASSFASGQCTGNFGMGDRATGNAGPRLAQAGCGLGNTTPDSAMPSGATPATPAAGSATAAAGSATPAAEMATEKAEPLGATPAPDSATPAVMGLRLGAEHGGTRGIQELLESYPPWTDLKRLHKTL